MNNIRLRHLARLNLLGLVSTYEALVSTKKEAACYSVRAGVVAGGWCRLSWTRGAAAAEGF